MPQTAKNRLFQFLKALLIAAGVYVFYFVMQILVNTVAINGIALWYRASGLNGDDYVTQVEAVFNQYFSVVYIACVALTILLIVIAFRIFQKPFPAAVRLQKLDFEIAVLAFIVGIFLNVAISAANAMIPYPQEWIDANNESVSSFSAGNVWINLFATCIAAPVVEEILYRGLIYNILKRASSAIPAAIVSSVMFGIFHGNPLQALYAGTAALLLVYVYERSGSLIGSILAHAGFNSSYLFTGGLYEGLSGLSLLFVALLILTGITILFTLRSRLLRRRGADDCDT